MFRHKPIDSRVDKHSDHIGYAVVKLNTTILFDSWHTYNTMHNDGGGDDMTWQGKERRRGWGKGKGTTLQNANRRGVIKAKLKADVKKKGGDRKGTTRRYKEWNDSLRTRTYGKRERGTHTQRNGELFLPQHVLTIWPTIKTYIHIFF